VIESVVRRAADKERMVAMETQIALQNEHNQKLLASQTQIRQLSHDFKYHMDVLQTLSEQGQHEELSEKINELTHRQKNIRSMLDTGNPMIDAVLTAKRDLAESQGIEWRWDVRIPAELPVPSIDLCAILGNALDNAIEANLRTDADRFIFLDLHTSDNMLLFDLKNAVGQQPLMKNGEIQTSKADAKHHGIGLKSIQECCGRLGGEMSFLRRGIEAELRILLPF
jgi:sensor histidine kinase regulating citrate/malate metabolism